MKTWLMGFSEFLLRYKLVWSETWKIRKQLDTPVREKDENEFLPAHLELIETPVSRRPRLVAYFIMGFLVIAVILSVLGQVEIVATANGKLTLSGRSKEIKPIENSIVKEIIVKEGESVRKGDVLLKLTALGAEADTLKTQSSLLQTRLEQTRYQILSRSIELNKLPELKLPDEPYFQNVSEEEVLRLTSLIKEQFSTWQNQKYQKELNLDKKRAERLTILARINRYENLSRVEKAVWMISGVYCINRQLQNMLYLSRRINMSRQQMNYGFINRNWSKLRVRYCLQKKNISLSRSFLK